MFVVKGAALSAWVKVLLLKRKPEAVKYFKKFLRDVRQVDGVLSNAQESS